MVRSVLVVLLVASVGFAAKPKKRAIDAGVLTVVDAGTRVVDAGTPVVDAGVAIAPPPTATVAKLALVVEEVLFHSTTPVSSIDGKTKSMEAIADGDFVTLS